MILDRERERERELEKMKMKKEMVFLICDLQRKERKEKSR
jgi:hypothetical protein